MASQLSLVHALLSLQTSSVPLLQAPLSQASSLVQALPSLHPALLGALMQPLPPSQLSSVHGLPSLHCSAPQPLQTPAPQPSLIVQALPSLQAVDAS